MSMSLSWQLVEPLFCIMLTLLLLFLWMLMLILFSSLINSSLLDMLTFLKQWSFSCCLMWMFCLYSNVSHWIRWELISHYTSMLFWFRVEVCWFSTVVSAVKNAVWRSFQNVVVFQNISKDVTASANDIITLLTTLYATMMCSLSSFKHWEQQQCWWGWVHC